MALSASQQEFHDLLKKKEQILAEIEPTQKEYDDLRAQQVELNEKLKPVKAKLKEAKAPIYGIDVRRAQIARSLQGKTGKPD